MPEDLSMPEDPMAFHNCHFPIENNFQTCLLRETESDEYSETILWDFMGKRIKKLMDHKFSQTADNNNQQAK